MLLKSESRTLAPMVRSTCRWVFGSTLTLSLLGCGGRTPLRGGENECELDEDCDQSRLCFPQSCIQQRCVVEPVECESGDACEQVACNPASGVCESIALTFDLDGDGFKAPLPGFVPGTEGSCGDDCDDTSASAYPGGTEICDGVDNDCDGVVDNGSLFLQLDATPTARLLDPDSDSSSRKGLAYGDGVFAAGYWSSKDGARSSWITGLDEYSLNELWTEEAVLINAESFGGDLVWSGDAFGSTWSDLRFDSNYEVFFNRFNTMGEKLGPDLRITSAPSFSTQSIVRFDQGRYILLWSDQRGEVDGIGSQVFAQIVDAQGRAVGGNRAISDDEEYAEGPELATTPTRFGAVYTDSPGLGQPDEGNIRLVFTSFDKDFADRRAVRLADDDVKEPRIAGVDGGFVVTWSIFGQAPGPNIIGTVLDEMGQILVPPQPITSGANYARSSTLLSFGDRFMLVWIDDLDGNFEMYAQVMDLEFNVLEGRVRLTDDAEDTESPLAIRAASGTIGITFDDFRTGQRQAYFTALECRAVTLD